jgi:hypothetical protein
MLSESEIYVNKLPFCQTTPKVLLGISKQGSHSSPQPDSPALQDPGPAPGPSPSPLQRGQR